MATTKKQTTASAAKSASTTSPSLTEVLKDSSDDVSTSIKSWADFVRAVPTTINEPTKLVQQYFDLREQGLARRRERVLAFVGAAPKAKVPHVSIPQINVPQVSLPQVPRPQVSIPGLRRSGADASDADGASA